MSTRRTSVPSGLTPQPPSVAFEIAAGRVTVAEISSGGEGLVVSAYASESVPDDAVTPLLSGTNIADPAVVTAALRRACEKAGIRPPKRAALIVPDSVARVSLLTFEELPAKAADIDQLVRWQIKKSTPFPIEDAQVSAVITHQAAGATTVLAMASQRAVISQYEAAVTALGTHVGLVDLASVNVLNAILANGNAPAGDWLLVCLAKDSTSLAIVRDGALMFYRHRLAVDDEPLGALVHQTAMYHEDRLGGAKFSRVWLCGSTWAEGGGEAMRREISQRLGVQADAVDVRAAAALRDRIAASPDILDALAAPIGVLVRERKVA
jgi:Tfp pilus assembly PilM family ATPase